MTDLPADIDADVKPTSPQSPPQSPGEGPGESLGARLGRRSSGARRSAARPPAGCRPGRDRDRRGGVRRRRQCRGFARIRRFRSPRVRPLLRPLRLHVAHAAHPAHQLCGSDRACLRLSLSRPLSRRADRSACRVAADAGQDHLGCVGRQRPHLDRRADHRPGIAAAAGGRGGGPAHDRSVGYGSAGEAGRLHRHHADQTGHAPAHPPDLHAGPRLRHGRRADPRFQPSLLARADAAISGATAGRARAALVGQCMAACRAVVQRPQPAALPGRARRRGPSSTARSCAR